MNRLPAYDRTTQRSELAVFLSLGLAGVTVIALAVVQTTEFAAGSHRPNTALMDQTEPLTAPTRKDANESGATNVTGPTAARAATHDFQNGALRSASDSQLGLLLR